MGKLNNDRPMRVWDAIQSAVTFSCVLSKKFTE
jgi:hypothetical protein